MNSFRASLVFGKKYFSGVEGANVRIHKDAEYSGIEQMLFAG